METIYGMMITGMSPFRYRLAELTIDAFFTQTYPNKHLIIVNCGEKSLARPGVTELFSSDPTLTLGCLRNLALAQVPEGAIVNIWDDDDIKHPNLLTEQYNALIKKNADLCILARHTIYYAEKDFVYVPTGHGPLAMTKMFRRHAQQYNPLKCGEDIDYFKEYGNKHKAVFWDNPNHYYVRLVHGTNTCAIEYQVKPYVLEKTWLIDKEHMPYIRDVVARYATVL